MSRQFIVLGDDPNPNREIAIALQVAADMRRAGRIVVAGGWVHEARRLRRLREHEEAEYWANEQNQLAHQYGDHRYGW